MGLTNTFCLSCLFQLFHSDYLEFIVNKGSDAMGIFWKGPESVSDAGLWAK